MGNVLVVNGSSRRCYFSIHFAAIGSGQVHRRRTYNGQVGVAAGMSFGRLEFGMHAFVGEVYKEWFLFIALVEPVDGIVGEQVGGVTVFRLFYRVGR